MNPKDLIINTTKELLDKIGIAADVAWDEGNAHISVVSIMSQENLGALIGKQGVNMAYLEHLIRLIAMRRSIGTNDTAFPSFLIDLNNYRRHHLEQILDSAKTVAQRVVQNKRAESLPPMASYERRAVHAELSAYKGVATESTGREPNRRVMVKPSMEFGIDI